MIRYQSRVPLYATAFLAAVSGTTHAGGPELGFDPACYEERLINDTPIPGGNFDRFQSNGERAVLVRDDTLLVYDIRDRGNVQLLSSTPLADLRHAAIDLSSDHVYVQVGQREIQIYDISVPHDPQLIQSGDNSHDIIFIEAAEGFLYVGDRTERLNVYDSSAFQDSTLIQSRVARFNYGPTYYSRIAISGSVACLISPSRGNLSVIDISNPGNPENIETISGLSLRNATISEDWIAVDRSSSIRLYEINDDKSISLANEYQIDGASIAQRIPGSDLLALVQREQNVYHHLDISDLNNPTIVKSFDLTREVDFRWSNEQVALIESNSDSLSFIDIRTPDESIYTSRLIEQSNERFLGLEDGLAYVAPTSQFPPFNVRVNDYRASDTAQPADVFQTQSSPEQVIGTSGVTFIRTDDGIEIYDSIEASDFRLLSTIQSSNDSFSAMQLRDNLLVVNQGTQLLSYDVSDASSPALLGSTDIGMMLDELYFDGDSLVGVDDSFIHTLVYTNPTSVTPLSSIRPQTSTNSIAVHDGFVYAGQRLPESSSNSTLGMEAIKIRDPRNPVSMLIPNSTFSVVGIDIVEDELWAFTRLDRDGFHGSIYIYNLSDPAEPIQSRVLDIIPGTPSFGTTDGQIVIGDINSAVLAMDLRDQCSYCPADITRDAQLNALDATEFIDLFTSNDAYADYNFDGELNFFDVAEFLNAYFAGCP